MKTTEYITQPATTKATIYTEPDTVGTVPITLNDNARIEIIVCKSPNKDDTSDGLPPGSALPDYYTFINSTTSNCYITAEVRPDPDKPPVAIGDGRSYRGYYNAPLDPQSTYRIFTRNVTTADGITRYGEAKRSIVFKTPAPRNEKEMTTKKEPTTTANDSRIQIIVCKSPNKVNTSDVLPPRSTLPDYRAYIRSTTSRYYITAEVAQHEPPVAIGDGDTYGKYYNAPLDPQTTYQTFTRDVRQMKNGTIIYDEAKRSTFFKTPPRYEKHITTKKVLNKSWIEFTPSIITILLIIILIIVIAALTIVNVRRSPPTCIQQKKTEAKPKQDEDAYMTVDECLPDSKKNKKDTRQPRGNTMEMTTHYEKALPTGQVTQGQYEGLNIATRTPQVDVKATAGQYASIGPTYTSQQYEPLQGRRNTTTYEIVANTKA